MPEPKKSLLENLAELLPTLLAKLEKSLADDATALDQAEAFELGCSLLTDLIKLLEGPDSPLRSLDGIEPFAVNILGEGLKKFLEQEKALLKRHKFEPKQIDRLLELLKQAHDSGETKNLQVDAKQVIETISQFREIVCAIKLIAQEGQKIPKELLGACFDSTCDVGVIVGDCLVIPFSVGHGNPGGVVLGIASIGVGMRNLKKHLSRAKDFFTSFRNSRKAANLKEKAPKKKLK